MIYFIYPFLVIQSIRLDIAERVEGNIAQSQIANFHFANFRFSYSTGLVLIALYMKKTHSTT